MTERTAAYHVLLLGPNNHRTDTEQSLGGGCCAAVAALIESKTPSLSLAAWVRGRGPPAVLFGVCQVFVRSLSGIRSVWPSRSGGVSGGADFALPVLPANAVAFLLRFPLAAPVGAVAVFGAGMFGLFRLVTHQRQVPARLRAYCLSLPIVFPNGAVSPRRAASD